MHPTSDYAQRHNPDSLASALRKAPYRCSEGKEQRSTLSRSQDVRSLLPLSAKTDGKVLRLRLVFDNMGKLSYGAEQVLEHAVVSFLFKAFGCREARMLKGCSHTTGRLCLWRSKAFRSICDPGSLLWFYLRLKRNRAVTGTGSYRTTCPPSCAALLTYSTATLRVRLGSRLSIAGQKTKGLRNQGANDHSGPEEIKQTSYLL